MTPEVVLYRYLQLVNAEDVSLPQFIELVGMDADLLARWLRLLACPASPRALREGIESLEPWTFVDLAQAQAWSVLPPGSSMRLGFDQWRSVYKSALLGELLAEQLSLPDPQATRWRLHLAMSGVNLAADPNLIDLIEYRGTRAELLEDAPPEHKILAVLDASEVQETSAVAQLTERLLGISAFSFTTLSAEAGHRCDAQLQQAGLETAGTNDRTEELWDLQQVNLLAGLFLQGNSNANVQQAHTLAGKTLFETPPALFLLDPADSTLVAPEQRLQNISLNSASSKIAQAIRELRQLELVDSSDCAVADRQVLRSLDAEEGLILPLQVRGEGIGVLVFAVDDDVAEGQLIHAYSSALSRWLAASSSGSESGTAQLSSFREQEEKRLRTLVHEINNPLSIVSNYLHILELRLQHEPDATEQLSIIGRELRRAADLLQQVREVPRGIEVDEPKAQVTVAEFEVNRLVEQIHQIHLGYAAEHEVDLRLALQPGTFLLRSDEQRVIQVLNNLLKNAIEAGDAASWVRISTQGGVYRQGQRGVEIMVADDGPGISSAVLDRLYEPKQSTKGGDHSGLGLHIVHQLVKDISASVDLRTAAGQGTEFTLFLPLSPSS